MLKTGNGYLRRQNKHRLGRYCLSLFLVLVMLPGFLPGTFPFMTKAIAGTGDQWDLFNFTTGIVVKDAGGNPIAGDTVTIGQEYILSITYEEGLDAANTQFLYDSSGFLLYQLPAGIEIETEKTGQPISGTGSAPIGEYSVDLGGLVMVKFYDVDEDGIPKPSNFIDQYTTARFTLDLFACFNGSEGSTLFDFGNNVKITLTLEPEDIAAPVIVKTAGAFDYENQTVEYTIEITATDGDAIIKSFSDCAQRTGGSPDTTENLGTAYIDLGNIEVKNNVVTISDSDYDVYWIGGSNPPEFEIEFYTPVTVIKGQQLSITYTMELKDYIISSFGASAPLDTNGFFRGNYIFNIDNEATVLYWDADNSDQALSDNTRVPVNHEPVKKNGRYIPGGSVVGSGSIFWDVTIGDGIHRLNDCWVKDTLGVGFAPTVRPDEITMTMYGIGGINTASIIGTATVKTSMDGTFVWDYLGAQPTGSDTTYFFIPGSSYPGLLDNVKAKDGGDTSTPIYYITFTYSTLIIVGDPSGEQEFSNIIELEAWPPPGIGSWNTVIVNVGSEIIASKTTERIYKDTNGKYYADFKISMDVPSALYNHNVYLADILFESWDWVYFVENHPLDVEFKVTNKDASTTTVLTQHGEGLDNYDPGDKVYNETTFTLLKIIEQNDRERYFWFDVWPFNYNADVEISYRIRLDDAYLLTENSDETVSTRTPKDGNDTILELLRQDKSAFMGNYFNILVDGVAVTSGLRSFVNWPVHKEAAIVSTPDGDVIDYTVYLNYGLNYGIMPAAFTTDNAFFYDEFDDRFEYVPKSFYTSICNAEYMAFGPYTGPAETLISDVSVTENPDAITAVPGSIAVDFSEFVGVDYSTGINWEEAIIASDFSGKWYDPVNGTGAFWWASIYPTDSSNNPNDYRWYSWRNVDNGDATFSFVVHYQLKPKDGADLLDQVTVINTASVDGYTVFDCSDGDFFSESQIKYGNPVADKSMTNSGNTATFSIVVNPDGKKLTPPGTNLHVVDQMINTLAFYLTSIRVYTESIPGSGVFDDPATMTQLAEIEGNGDEWTWALTDDNEITLVLPDEKPLKIVYNALIKGDVGQKVEIENYAEVNGFWYGEVADEWTVLDTSSLGGGTRDELLLYKKDSLDTGTYLPGASVALYIGRDSVWNYGGNTPPVPPASIGGTTVDIPPRFTIDNTIYFYYLGCFTTELSGSVLISDTWLNSELDAVYALVELIAPDGYDLPEFDLDEEIYDAVTLFAFMDAPDVGTLAVNEILTDNFDLYNVETETPDPEIPDPVTGSLEVSKVLSGNATDPNKDFTFTVTFSDGGIYDGVASGDSFTLKGGGSKTIAGIPLDVSYSVTEAEANTDRYTTTSSGATGTISETLSKAIFTNRRNTDSGSSPPPDPPADPPTTPPATDPPAEPPTTPPQEDPPAEDPPAEQPTTPPPAEPTARPPYYPGGVEQSVPPNPRISGHDLIPDGVGYIELGEDGTPLGRWEWDDDEGVWVFEEYPPLAVIPKTGENRSFTLWLLLFGSLFFGFVLKRLKKIKPYTM